jgi:hypothetical protein
MTHEPTPADQSEIDYGEEIIFRLVGAKITMFGANGNGEIFLFTEREGVVTKVIIGKDEHGEITLFEAELQEVSND